MHRTFPEANAWSFRVCASIQKAWWKFSSLTSAVENSTSRPLYKRYTVEDTQPGSPKHASQHDLQGPQTAWRQLAAPESTGQGWSSVFPRGSYPTSSQHPLPPSQLSGFHRRPRAVAMGWGFACGASGVSVHGKPCLESFWGWGRWGGLQAQGSGWALQGSCSSEGLHGGSISPMGHTNASTHISTISGGNRGKTSSISQEVPDLGKKWAALLPSPLFPQASSRGNRRVEGLESVQQQLSSLGSQPRGLKCFPHCPCTWTLVAYSFLLTGLWFYWEVCHTCKHSEWSQPLSWSRLD